MTRTKAVIFDCFGVLTADGLKHLREEFWGNDSASSQHIYDMSKAVNAGYLGYDQFVSEISKMSGLQIDEVRQRINGASPNNVLFEYIRDGLREKTKIGMLSNAADDWLNTLFSEWQVRLFDEIVLSYQVGAVKPEHAMYQAITQRLGVGFEECVFIDDSESYCRAAQNLGMSTIWHQDTHDTIAKLRELVDA